MDFPHFTSSALNSSATGDSSAVDPNASPATDILLFVVLPIAVGAVLVAAICWAIIKCQNRAKSTSKPAGKLKRKRGGIELQARDAEQRGELGEAEGGRLQPATSSVRRVRADVYCPQLLSTPRLPTSNWP